MSHIACCIPRDTHYALKRLALERSKTSGTRVTLSDVLTEALTSFACVTTEPVIKAGARNWVKCPDYQGARA